MKLNKGNTASVETSDNQPCKIEETEDRVVLLITRKDGTKVRTDLSQTIRVICKTLDDNNRAGRLLIWQDGKGEEVRWHMPMEMLADPRHLLSELLGKGFDVEADLAVFRHLVKWIQKQKPEHAETRPYVTRPGWHGEAYFLPGKPSQTFGKTAETIVYEGPSESCWTPQGTLEDWQKNVAAHCLNNSLLLLAGSCAFAGPILKLVKGSESTGFALVGPSGNGKTTVQLVGASICGSPKLLRSWNTTPSGLEAVAEAHTDNCLFLNEIKLLNPYLAPTVPYLLGNGEGKVRSNRHLESVNSSAWLFIYLSSGEITLDEHAASVGRRLDSGAQARLLNILADTGVYGCFEDLHGMATGGAEFSKLLRANAASYYGTALRAFLTKLTECPKQVAEKLEVLCSAWLIKYASDVSAKFDRAAKAFSKVAAAGELATQFGITGWPEDSVFKAVGRCFKDYVAYQEKHGEAQLLLSSLRHALQKHVSRFPELSSSSKEMAVNNLYGYRRSRFGEPTGKVNGWGWQKHAEHIEFLIIREVFQVEICRGGDYRILLEFLKARGLLIHNKDRNDLAVRNRLLGSFRVYGVKADVLRIIG